MSYTITAYNPREKAVEQASVDTIAEAQTKAQTYVNDRMDAFGESREALTSYGFIDAEDQALAMDEDGGTIFLQDGWKIEVINNNDKE